MKKSVLIVEDNLEIRKLIRMTLECEFYQIEEVGNAAEALEAIRKFRPQLLILDIMMPGEMNGLDLCRLIKADSSYGAPQVVMLTARGSKQDIQAGLDAGADAYLVKPFSPRQLIVSVDSLGTQVSEIDYESIGNGNEHPPHGVEGKNCV